MIFINYDIVKSFYTVGKNLTNFFFHKDEKLQFVNYYISELFFLSLPSVWPFLFSTGIGSNNATQNSPQRFWPCIRNVGLAFPRYPSATTHAPTYKLISVLSGTKARGNTYKVIMANSLFFSLESQTVVEYSERYKNWSSLYKIWKKTKKTIGCVELDIKYWCIFDLQKGGGGIKRVRGHIKPNERLE